MFGALLAGMNYEPSEVIAFALYIVALESGAADPESLDDKVVEMIDRGLAFLHTVDSEDKETAKYGVAMMHRRAEHAIRIASSIPGNN